jgi:3-phenylpropionate/trans-cinnamate dioxygenase ferredoxin component
MPVLATDTFRPVGPGDAIPNGVVVPYYLDDRKLRISVARVGGRVYAFDDLCTCARSPGACSGERRSCANATGRASTRPPEP